MDTVSTVQHSLQQDERINHAFIRSAYIYSVWSIDP